MYLEIRIIKSESTMLMTIVCVQVLEPQNVDPSMIQMTFLDDVVHSLLKGENIGITSRRRSRSSQNNNSSHVSTETLQHNLTVSQKNNGMICTIYKTHVLFTKKHNATSNM